MTMSATDQSRAISPVAEANNNSDTIHSPVIPDLLTALRDITASLEPLVVGPPATSLPAQRARYQVDLIKRMLSEGHPWRYYRVRIDEFAQRNRTKP